MLSPADPWRPNLAIASRGRNAGALRRLGLRPPTGAAALLSALHRTAPRSPAPNLSRWPWRPPAGPQVPRRTPPQGGTAGRPRPPRVRRSPTSTPEGTRPPGHGRLWAPTSRLAPPQGGTAGRARPPRGRGSPTSRPKAPRLWPLEPAFGPSGRTPPWKPTIAIRFARRTRFERCDTALPGPGVKGRRARPS